MTSTETTSLLEIYLHRRSEVLAIARRQHEILVALGLDETQSEGTKPAELVAELTKRLESEQLRVLVIGRFSAGKSTLINALLGEAVLPASPVPTTGVLCEIRHAQETHKKAVLHPKPGMGPAGSSEPIDVAITDLQKEMGKYVKINSTDSNWTSRYQKLELYWPLELCEHGVDIIDSVGLDDPDSRDQITMEQAATADAIIYCMKSQDAYSAKDKQVIRFLQSLGYRSILFVITYWDHIKESAALGEMTEEQYAAQQRRNLAEWTELKNDGILFVDSKSALLGRTQSDYSKVADSGIQELEQQLQRFLSEEKGRAKLLTSLWTLRSVNRIARTAIPTRIELWQTATSDLEKRYKEAEIPLQSLETQRKLIVAEVDIAAKDIAREAGDLAGRHFLVLPERIQSWAEPYEFENDIGFPPTRQKIKSAVEEMTRYLKEQTEEEIARWTQEELTPMVTARMQQLEGSLEASARAFIEKIDQLRFQVCVGTGEYSVEQREASVFGRILAGTYMVMTRDFLTGGMGVFLGAKAMATTMVLQLASGFLLGALGLVNPFALVAATVATILAGGFLNLKALKRGIKKKVGESLSADLVAKREQLSKEIEGKVAERLSEVKRALDSGLGGEIASVRDEVEAVLAAKRRGQADAEVEIRTLEAIQETNLAVEEQIDALMHEAIPVASRMTS